MKKKKTELKPLTLPDLKNDLKDRKIIAPPGKGKQVMVAAGKKNTPVPGIEQSLKKSVALPKPGTSEKTGNPPVLVEIYRLLVEINDKLDKMQHGAS